MNTTNLFVELIVSGVGAAIWVFLLVLTLFNVDRSVLASVLSMPAMAIPALAFVYLLGILTDRLSDVLTYLFHADRKLIARFGTKDAYFAARKKCISHGEFYAQLYEYNRSRQRICRGWFLNSLLSIAALHLLHAFRSDVLALTRSELAWITVLVVGLALACFFSWKKLLDTELERIGDFSS